MIRNDPKEWGRVVESAVGAHLINYAMSEKFNLNYWREGNHEVDFVLEKNGTLIALEVKSGMESYTQGMTVFEGKFHPDKMLLVGIGGIPIADFLRLDPRELF